MPNVKNFIIGVAGGSGSGKTTFVRELANLLGPEMVTVVQQDSYYIDRSHQFKGDGSLNFDHPDALDWDLMAEHLSQLGRGKSVQTPIYDFTTHSRFPQTQHTEARPIILVDGILIFHPETIVNMLDLKIFIETAEPVRFARRLRRDVTERGRTPEGVRDQYRLSVKPMHDLFVEPSKRLADQIISGEEPFTAKLHSLVKQIRERVAIPVSVE